MNLDKLSKKLIVVARLDTPSDVVPYAFEKRIMAILASMKPLAPATFWTRALWYGAGACAAISLAVSAWSFLPANEQISTADLSQDLDTAVFAMVNQENDSW
jgi:hypothetical protein